MLANYRSNLLCFTQRLINIAFRHSRQCYRSSSTLCTIIACSLAWGNSLQADFDTIINLPEDELPRFGRIDSNTQINIFPEGVLDSPYLATPVWEPADNIEVNLLGGTIAGGLRTGNRWRSASNVAINLSEGTVTGDVYGTNGTLVTMSGATVNRGINVDGGSLATVSGGVISRGLTATNGSIVQLSGGIIGNELWGYGGEAGASGGSVFLMSGGTVHGGFGIQDSYASLSGGRIERELHVHSSAQLEISGGSHGPIQASGSGKATLVGGDFQLDGVPIEGLATYSQSFEFPKNSILTGVLADGSPVILNNDTGYLHDRFPDNQISLRQAQVPESAPRHFDAPRDEVPVGLRAEQSLTLRLGAQALTNFSALPGSSVSVLGGSIDHGFEAVGADVTLTEGKIGEHSIIYRDTTLKMTGGEIGSNFETGPGSRFELSGGQVGDVFVAHEESVVNYSGGKFAPSLQAKPGSSFTIAGGDFRLNGTPIDALGSIGATQQIDLPESGVISGTLSNGNPFVFSADMHWFAPGTLTLEATEVPAASSTIIRLPNDPVPEGLRAGQTLLMTDGAEVGNYFTADWGSIVRMNGGQIGHRFLATGSFVNVNKGTIRSMDALLGSVVNIAGGSVEHSLRAHRGSVVNLSAGSIDGTVSAWNGGRVNISGGSAKGLLYANNGSSLNVSGGTIEGDIRVSEDSSLTVRGGDLLGEISLGNGSNLEIAGGRLGDGLWVTEDSRALVRGSEFRIDGELIEGDEYGFFREQIDLQSGAVLSGVLSDGTPFAFSTSDGDHFSPGTLDVWSSRFRIPQVIGISINPRQVPRGLRPGQELLLEEGDHVGPNFTAGWGSTLTVAGGEIGANFEAVGAQIDVVGGVIGENMDAMFGTQVNISGGTIGWGLEAHRGSVLNITGGNVQELTARAGSEVNISGGTFGEEYDSGDYHGYLAMEEGSELHLVGSDFMLDYEPIDWLEPGASFVLELDERNSGYVSLRATLQDGSPFSISFLNQPSYDDWQFSGKFTVTLTEALPGDFDGNQLVDAGDLAAWQDHYGENEYGQILRDGSDFLSWQSETGENIGTLINLQVPEPESWQTIGLLITMATLAYRKKWNQ